ncbi:hypothetical protein ASF88_03750 [Leifsonia sp. Leaf336]|nr:hypothetical protein ASF88_03750 [Leifsonia sp. Leaf336]
MISRKRAAFLWIIVVVGGVVRLGPFAQILDQFIAEAERASVRVFHNALTSDPHRIAKELGGDSQPQRQFRTQFSVRQ